MDLQSRLESFVSIVSSSPRREYVDSGSLDSAESPAWIEEHVMLKEKENFSKQVLMLWALFTGAGSVKKQISEG